MKKRHDDSVRDTLAPQDDSEKSPVAPAPSPVRSGLRFPTMVDLLALVGIWYLLQLGALFVALVAGCDLSAAEDGAATEAQQVAMGRLNAFVYLATMGLMLPITLLYRRLRGGTRKVLRFSARGLDPLLLLWGFVMMLAAGAVIEPVMTLLPAPPSSAYGRGFWAVLCVVGMAPVFEEVLCRGVILESVRAKYGVVAALFLPALFFAVLHGHPALAFNAFVMGLILGFIYIETDSIFSTILLHALNNGVAFLLIVVGWDEMTLRSLLGDGALYWTVYAAVLALFLFSGVMIYLRLSREAQCEKKDEAQCEKKDETQREKKEPAA